MAEIVIKQMAIVEIFHTGESSEELCIDFNAPASDSWL
jgi:hypothetical protein